LGTTKNGLTSCLESHWRVSIAPQLRSQGALSGEGTLTETGKQIVGVFYAVAMAAVIVGVDVAFFRGRFWERLAANIGIVLVFVAFYFRYFRRP
jgi:hypothetical protein